MKKIVLGSLLAFGASTLLAGCGLIPAQTVANPLGLEDASLTSTTLTAASASVRVAGTGTASATATFADISSLPLTPAKIDISLALKSATISAGCVAATGDIQVTLTNFTVSLADGAGNTARSLSAVLPTTSFTVNATTGAITGLSLTSLAFSIPDIGKAVSILTTAPTPNTVNVNTNIATSPALPGCTIAFKFGAGSGTFSF